ncbi:MAG TPA: UDP-N-acetylmuramoylalanyl-D-glutamate--2,6-diaminopimelate ligase, partial [Treponema sp.]|nr:UDP-N-acetylmuramoylalanyl-D-glutamate--2,6-diaminopimelate ligase [Treponema sp.]
AAFEKTKNSSVKNIIFIAGNSQDSMEKAALEIKKVLHGSLNSIVFIKGSRGMGLERISKILLGGDE